MWDFTNDAALEFDVVSVYLSGGGGPYFQIGPVDLFRFEFLKLV